LKISSNPIEIIENPIMLPMLNFSLKKKCPPKNVNKGTKDIIEFATDKSNDLRTNCQIIA
jgi:hypothetical protein